MLPSLYVLANEYRETADRLAELELDDQTVQDTLEGMSGDLEAKSTNVAMFVRNLEAQAIAIKDAEKQMADRRKAIEKRAERVKLYLRDSMIHAGIQKIESPYFKLAIRENPAAVTIDDERQIPATYLRQPEPPPPAPDKAAIKAALLAGTDVPGARITHSMRVDIR